MGKEGIQPRRKRRNECKSLFQKTVVKCVWEKETKKRQNNAPFNMFSLLLGKKEESYERKQEEGSPFQIEQMKSKRKKKTETNKQTNKKE